MNTPQENLLARNALNQLVVFYGQYMTNSHFFNSVLAAPSDQFFNYIKFMDNIPFQTNLQLSGKIPDGCQVNGSTDRVGTRFAHLHSVVYINRLVATAGTVVHELLHACSHNDWYLWALFKPNNLNEAVTEYLTRKITRKSTEDIFLIDRTGIYERELEFLLGAKKIAKTATMTAKGGRRGRNAPQQPVQPERSLGDDIRQAYFTGQVPNRLSDALALWA